MSARQAALAAPQALPLPRALRSARRSIARPTCAAGTNTELLICMNRRAHARSAARSHF
jgi:hypothetical protein